MTKRLILTMLVLLLIAGVVSGCSQTYSSPPPDEESPPVIIEPIPWERDIEIRGPKGFQEDVQATLDMLEERSLEHYREVKTHIRAISLAETNEENKNWGGYFTALGEAFLTRHHYDLYLERSELLILPEYALALVLIHEAEHLKQYREGREYSGEQAEREALAAERSLLEALGADAEDIEKIAGDHLLETRWWEN